MNIQLAEIQKMYTRNKHNPQTIFLNPFTDLLFTDDRTWHEECIAHKKHSIKKNHSNESQLKEKIEQWFQKLDIQSKLNCLGIVDKDFISSFQFLLPSYSSQKIYNMKRRKAIPNFQRQDPNSNTQKVFKMILQNLQIAFLNQPILHLSKSLQTFINYEFIKWMEIISNHKIFQYANKIKKTQNPQNNPLWFSEESFHKLQSCFVNQFEKLIIRAYFNRDRIPQNYLTDIRTYCQMQKESFKLKSIQNELLDFPFSKYIKLGNIELLKKFKEMKQIEEIYQNQKQKTIEKLLQEQIAIDISHKKKRKRIRKKLTNVELSSTQKFYIPLRQKDSIQQNQLVEQSCKQNDRNQTIMQNPTQFDQISQIQKFQDIGFNQTDITIEKYFIDNQEKKLPTLIRSDLVISQDKNIEKEQKMIHNQSINDSFQTKIKKKSKKYKQIQEFQSNIIKTVRNGAFTQFIDGISIQSNNLYSFKLATYQFIAFFISSLLPPTNIYLFGSNAVGLSLASSDIDIMISNNRWSNIIEVRQGLYQIGNLISKMGWVVDYKLILNAKVPVLKLFIDPKVGYYDISPLKYTSDNILMESILIKADIIINIEGDQNIGCESTFLMKQWLNEYPQLQRIILFFKYVLWFYGLNENYRGGICSYCIFIMVINCLFKKYPTADQKGNTILAKINDEDQGTYIVEILRFYSEEFDSKNDQINISKTFKSDLEIEIKNIKSDSGVVKRLLNLKIIDPINKEYIESSFSRFEQIKQLFSMILFESIQADNLIKIHLINHQEINQQLYKIYNSLLNSPNVLTKNNEANSQEMKIKRLTKKIGSKLKKNQQIKYNVKDIVSVGFKIGVDNWMQRNSQQKVWN